MPQFPKPRPFITRPPVRADARPRTRIAPVPDAARPALDRGEGDPQAGATIAAQREWQVHVDAGRIGTPAPPPAGAGDYRLAGLAAILGFGAGGGR
ncbi:hypothetical protein FHS31_002655 [Sphingomonas vulcanisoli]|uniref:Uncharacterized protein n=1 Tax=Sphingomonas vulcanisoli TaxID=1658060 RepID=A0ABX0TZ52_9SPHN|nr:hypothetical protein [Sphingomonas vulcanisoli]NIJ09025.1 hypothetical protein [Sphingomonas vulcanisoli]